MTQFPFILSPDLKSLFFDEHVDNCAAVQQSPDRRPGPRDPGRRKLLLVAGFGGASALVLSRLGRGDPSPPAAERATVDLVVGGVARPVRLPLLGRLAVHNALAAAAVGSVVGLAVDEIAAALADGWPVEHRGSVLRAGGVAIVDDTYNASPGSVRAALDLLAGLPGRRIAVLGEMLELGPAHERGHRAVGEAAATVVDHLVVVGPGARGIVDGALGAGLPPTRLRLVPDRSAAVPVLLDLLRPGDVVLVKASRGIALDVLVAELVAALGGSGGGGR